MIDPQDSETLDLVEACKRPLTPAERAKRAREKRKAQRQVGQRAQLDLKAPELAVLSVALGEYRERWQRVPSKLKAVDALLPRIPQVSIQDVFPGDSAWLPDAAQRMGRYPDYIGQSTYSVDTSGCHAPLHYRQTPLGQPEVDQLVKPGDVVMTNYGTGPYVVCAVTRHEWRGMRCYSLSLRDAGDKSSEPTAWINELVAVDGRLLKLFGNNNNEVLLLPHEDAAGGGCEAAVPIYLTQTDRCTISLGLLAHEDLDHRDDDWETSKKPVFNALLRKLWPESDGGLYLVEPQRSTYRPAGFLRRRIERLEAEIKRHQEVGDEYRSEIERLKATIVEIGQLMNVKGAAPVLGKDDPAKLRRDLEAKDREISLLWKERGQLDDAFKVLEQRLRKHGLSTDYRPQLGDH